MKAVILAAGRGSHLGDLTKDRPKPMIELGGKAILEYILQGVQTAGIKDVIIISGYKGDLIKQRFGDGSAIGVRIKYIWQAVQDGTGSALQLCQAAVKNEPFFVVYGDIIMDFSNYVGIKQAYKLCPADALIGVREVADPWRGAAVYFNKSNQIFKIVEKPPLKTSRSKWIYAGLCILKPIVFEYTERLIPSSRGEFELTNAFQMMIDANLDVRAHILGGVWLDFPTPMEVQKGTELVKCLSEPAIKS